MKSLLSSAHSILLLVAFTLFIQYVSATERQFNGYSVLRIKARTSEQMHFLKKLSEERSDLDFWKPPTSLDIPVDIMVSAQKRISLEKELSSHGIQAEVMIKNLQSLISEQKQAMTRSNTRDFFASYQRVSAIHGFMNDIANADSSFASVESIGKSSEGRDLLVLKLGVNHASNSKPVVWIDGGIHAREWISPATVTYFIQTLVDGYKNKDAAIVKLVQTFDWYFLPVVNPDGYEYTHTNDRMWRKTRSKNTGSSCFGVDANRNFGYKYATGGSSASPCSDTYRGPKAFSEPETEAIRKYITERKQRFKIYVAVHSYSQLWLFPWGWTSELTPDHKDLDAAATVAVKALTAVSGTKYQQGTSTNVLYVASGGADDWAYGDAGIIYSYTVELRDTGYYGFVLPPSQIKPSGVETSAAFIAMAQHVATKLRLHSG